MLLTKQPGDTGVYATATTSQVRLYYVPDRVTPSFLANSANAGGVEDFSSPSLPPSSLRWCLPRRSAPSPHRRQPDGTSHYARDRTADDLSYMSASNRPMGIARGVQRSAVATQRSQQDRVGFEKGFSEMEGRWGRPVPPLHTVPLPHTVAVTSSRELRDGDGSGAVDDEAMDTAVVFRGPSPHFSSIADRLPSTRLSSSLSTVPIAVPTSLSLSCATENVVFFVATSDGQCWVGRGDAIELSPLRMSSRHSRGGGTVSSAMMTQPTQPLFHGTGSANIHSQAESELAVTPQGATAGGAIRSGPDISDGEDEEGYAGEYVRNNSSTWAADTDVNAAPSYFSAAHLTQKSTHAPCSVVAASGWDPRNSAIVALGREEGSVQLVDVEYVVGSVGSTCSSTGASLDTAEPVRVGGWHQVPYTSGSYLSFSVVQQRRMEGAVTALDWMPQSHTTVVAARRPDGLGCYAELLDLRAPDSGLRYLGAPPGVFGVPVLSRGAEGGGSSFVLCSAEQVACHRSQRHVATVGTQHGFDIVQLWDIRMSMRPVEQQVFKRDGYTSLCWSCTEAGVVLGATRTGGLRMHTFAELSMDAKESDRVGNFSESHNKWRVNSSGAPGGRRRRGGADGADRWGPETSNHMLSGTEAEVEDDQFDGSESMRSALSLDGATTVSSATEGSSTLFPLRVQAQSAAGCRLPSRVPAAAVAWVCQTLTDVTPPPTATASVTWKLPVSAGLASPAVYPAAITSDSGGEGHGDGPDGPADFPSCIVESGCRTDLSQLLVLNARNGELYTQVYNPCGSTVTMVSGHRVLVGAGPNVMEISAAADPSLAVRDCEDAIIARLEQQVVATEGNDAVVECSTGGEKCQGGGGRVRGGAWHLSVDTARSAFATPPLPSRHTNPNRDIMTLDLLDEEEDDDDDCDARESDAPKSRLRPSSDSNHPTVAKGTSGGADGPVMRASLPSALPVGQSTLANPFSTLVRQHRDGPPTAPLSASAGGGAQGEARLWRQTLPQELSLNNLHRVERASLAIPRLHMGYSCNPIENLRVLLQEGKDREAYVTTLYGCCAAHLLFGSSTDVPLPPPPPPLPASSSSSLFPPRGLVLLDGAAKETDTSLLLSQTAKEATHTPIGSSQCVPGILELLASERATRTELHLGNTRLSSGNRSRALSHTWGSLVDTTGEGLNGNSLSLPSSTEPVVAGATSPSYSTNPFTPLQRRIPGFPAATAAATATAGAFGNGVASGNATGGIPNAFSSPFVAGAHRLNLPVGGTGKAVQTATTAALGVGTNSVGGKPAHTAVRPDAPARLSCLAALGSMRNLVLQSMGWSAPPDAFNVDADVDAHPRRRSSNTATNHPAQRFFLQGDGLGQRSLQEALERRVAVLVLQDQMEDAAELLALYSTRNAHYPSIALTLSAARQPTQLFNLVAADCKGVTFWMHLILTYMDLLISHQQQVQTGTLVPGSGVSPVAPLAQAKETSREAEATASSNGTRLESFPSAVQKEVVITLLQRFPRIMLSDKIALATALLLPTSYMNTHLLNLIDVLQIIVRQQYHCGTRLSCHDVLPGAAEIKVGGPATCTSGSPDVNTLPPIHGCSLLLTVAVEETGVDCRALQRYVDETCDVQTALCYTAAFGSTNSSAFRRWREAYRDLLNQLRLSLLRSRHDLTYVKLMRRRKEADAHLFSNANGGVPSGPVGGVGDGGGPVGASFHGSKGVLGGDYSGAPPPTSAAALMSAQSAIMKWPLKGLGQVAAAAAADRERNMRDAPIGNESSCTHRSVELRCNCGQAMHATAPSKASMSSITASTNQNRRQLAPCGNPECRQWQTPMCTVCGERMEHRSTELPPERFFAWCSVCLHGGHWCHLRDWFGKHTKCPVENCPCNCHDGVRWA